MKKRWLMAAMGLALMGTIQGQTREEIMRKPLKETLEEIADRFGVEVKYGREVENKMVEYAPFRLSLNAERSLTNVLYPFDLRFEKEGDAYVVSSFNYHKRSVAEGQEHLSMLLNAYPTMGEWEERRREVRENILQKIGLSPMPAKTPLHPVIKDKRVYKDYTVENVMIEMMPGVYLCGSIYKPKRIKGSAPAVICPHGHFAKGDIKKFDFTGWGRFRDDQQIRCAQLARMGCVVFSYNMFAQGEMAYQIPYTEHSTPLALTMQLLSGIRALDFVCTLKEVDVKRVGVTGASGGGTQTFLLAAVDERVTLTVPAVMVSAHFFGGCPCESGLPIHFLDKKLNTCNPEIAALTAPRPQLLISDGNDWTVNNPEVEYPYLRKVYGLYGKESNVELVHLPNDVHDYGPTKRPAMYRFIAKHFNLDIKRVEDKAGNIDESGCTVEPYDRLLFLNSANQLPVNALRSAEAIKARLISLQ